MQGGWTVFVRGPGEGAEKLQAHQSLLPTMFCLASASSESYSRLSGATDDKDPTDYSWVCKRVWLAQEHSLVSSGRLKEWGESCHLIVLTTGL